MGGAYNYSYVHVYGVMMGSEYVIDIHGQNNDVTIIILQSHSLLFYFERCIIMSASDWLIPLSPQRHGSSVEMYSLSPSSASGPPLSHQIGSRESPYRE